MRPNGDIRLGVLATVFAFVAWGMLPLFWKALERVDPVTVLAHRVVWSLALALILITAARRWGEIRFLIRGKSRVMTACAGAALLGVNWYIFILAVTTGRVVECSLGYFINPLMNVLFGCVLLRERLRSRQWAAVGFAAAGVLYYTLDYGTVPWIALSLATTFCLYGFVRKTARYEALPGLVMETCALAAPAAAYLVWGYLKGGISSEECSRSAFILLPLSGAVTVAPLLTFAYGARRIRYSTVGFIQYLTPTGMFLLGVFLYKEEFALIHMITFGAIWTGLILYTLDGILASRRR